MIYLIDSSQFKIVFDKSQIGRALALSLTAQEKLKEDQIAALTGQKLADEVDIEGHPLQVAATRINDKKTLEPVLDQTESINLSNVEWKVIKEESQEGDVKFVEIV